jgi:type VI protein secretion system component VasK
MGNIKTEEGITPDRRKSARIKLDLGDWLKIATVIIALILTGGKMQWTINNNSEALAEQKKEIKETSKLANDNRKDITSMYENVREIKQDVKELLKRR